MNVRRAALAIGAGAFAMLLAGCGAAESLSDAQASRIEAIAETQAGGDVDVGVGSDAVVPGGWPADVPVPAGDMIASAIDQGTLSVTVKLAEPDDGQGLVEQLSSEGYTVENSFEIAGGTSTILSNGVNRVLVSLGDDESGNTIANVTVTPA